MLTGDKNTFAIEAYLSQGSGYVFINYCFWVKQVMIGNIDESMVLNSAIPIFELVADLHGQRQIKELLEYSAPELMAYLRSELWGNGELKLSNQSPAPYNRKTLKKLDVCSNEGETFQGYYVFLLEHSDYDWLLCQENGSELIVANRIPKNYIYKVFRETLNWINSSTMLTLRSDFAQ